MSDKPVSPDTGVLAAEATALQEKPTEASPPATAPATGTTDLEKKVEEININDGETKTELAAAAAEKKAEAPATEAPATEEKPTEADKNAEEASAAVAAAPIPATTSEPAAAATETSTSGPTWPETGPEHPLTKFFETVEELTREAEHDEVWGITLSPSTNPFLTKLILQKYLRANQNDLTKAKEQLSDTLKWRKEFDPIAAADATYDKESFDGLGYIIESKGVPESPNEKDVITFNVYGSVKDNQKTFGDLDAFLKWRVGLMERSVQKLNLKAATKPIPDFGQGPDPYQGVQVHDYLQVSFFRQSPAVKAAAEKTIQVLGRNYPETLSRKFFVNVPAIMGWVFQARKLIVAKETSRKFTMLTYGNELIPELGKDLPKEYGGEKAELKAVGEGMKVE